jgi:hypothetical protein
LCDQCRLQVDFLVDHRATEARAERWREQHRLIKAASPNQSLT